MESATSSNVFSTSSSTFAPSQADTKRPRELPRRRPPRLRPGLAQMTTGPNTAMPDHKSCIGPAGGPTRAALRRGRSPRWRRARRGCRRRNGPSPAQASPSDHYTITHMATHPGPMRL
jgi:hypothetical protein